MAEKNCTKCGEMKPLSDYSPDKRASDGRQSRCRECCKQAHADRYYRDVEAARERQRDYYNRNREKVLAINAKSRETNREKVLKDKKDYYERVKKDPIWQESQRRKRRERRAEKAAYDRQYRAENAERLRFYDKHLRPIDPEKTRSVKKAYKARRKSWEKGGISGPELMAWEGRQEKICYWCGDECPDEYHIDHYVPLSKGGAHSEENLVISCPKCNIQKNAKDPYEFAQSFGKLF